MEASSAAAGNGEASEASSCCPSPESSAASAPSLVAALSPLLQPSPSSSLSARLSALVCRYPVSCLLLCLLPSLLSGVWLLLPGGPGLSIDYTYDQFRIVGDSCTVRDDMVASTRAASYASYRPDVDSQQQLQPQAQLQKPDWALDVGLQLRGADFGLSLDNGSSGLHAFSLTSASSAFPHRSYLGETLTVVYAAERNLLTSSVMRQIRRVEQAVQAAPGYDSHCRVYYTGEDMGRCILPSSVLNFMYPSSRGSELVFDGRGATLLDPTAVATGLLLNGVNGFFDRRCSLQAVRSSTLISQFTFGLPLPGYADIDDRLGQQRAQLRHWMLQLESVLAPFDGQLGVRVLREGGDIVQHEINAILQRDLVTVLLSVALVVGYMAWHTRSLLLTSGALLMMGASFPPALLLYRLCFGSSMSLMNVVSVWLILAIGTDDVFIYCDTWARYSRDGGKAAGDGQQGEAALSARLRWVHRRAASAMLVTSFTTAAGFFSTSVSLLLPIRQFGFFLGCVVCANYLLVISFLPAAVVAHDKYGAAISSRCGACRRLRSIAARCARGGRSASAPVLAADVLLDEADWAMECSSIVSPPRSPTAVMELLNVQQQQAAAARRSSGAQRGHSSLLPASLKESLLQPHEQEEGDADGEAAAQAPPSSLRSCLARLTAAVTAAPAASPSLPASGGVAPLHERVLVSYHGWLVRLRWAVLLLFVLVVALLSVRIPQLRPPSELPQILPLDSNVEQLRLVKRQLACDRCVQGRLDLEPNNPPATCPISQCSDPADFSGCEDVDCGEGGYCHLGLCVCRPGFFGLRCDGVDLCHLSDCGLRGSCSASTGRCECSEGWQGASCEVGPLCRDVRCGERGECSNADGSCLCLDGFSGPHCETPPPVLPPEDGNGSSPSGSLLPISASLSVQLSFLFGVSGVDMSAADNANAGRPVFDPAFDAASPAAQSALLSFCLQLLSNNSHARPELFRCPVAAFRDWLRATQGVQDWPLLPRPRFMAAFLNFMSSYEGMDYETDVGLELSAAAGNASTGSAASLRVSFIRVSSRTFVDADLSGLQLQAEFDWWDGWFAAWNSAAPAEAKGIQSSAAWPRMRTELAFIRGTLSSLLLSVGIVGLSILLFTGNWYLLCFTTVCISSVVLCLLGLFVLWDWPLGALEAISVPLVVGLSVDYCLHLSHAYRAAGSDEGLDSDGKRRPLASSRVARSRRALVVIGPSISAAAVTTVGCMCVLLACRIAVFAQFGTIVAVTLSIGLAFSLTAFMAALIIAGPQDSQGDVRQQLLSLRRACSSPTAAEHREEDELAHHAEPPCEQQPDASAAEESSRKARQAELSAALLQAEASSD